MGTNRKNIGLNAIVAGTGTVILIINILAPFAPNDDPTWMESLFGYKWENDLTRVVCAGIIAAGTISFFTYLGRSARIKSVIRKNFPASGSLNISPVMVLNHGTKTYCPGFRLSFNFLISRQCMFTGLKDLILLHMPVCCLS